MKLLEVGSNSQTEILHRSFRQSKSDSIVQTPLGNLSAFSRDHKGNEKAIKHLLIAADLDQKTKSDPYKTNPFSVPSFMFQPILI